MTDLAIRNAPKRVQFTIPLRFGGKDGDIEIGVAGYSLVSEQGKGQTKYVRMRGPVIEQVITKTQYTSVVSESKFVHLRGVDLLHAFRRPAQTSRRTRLAWRINSETKAPSAISLTRTGGSHPISYGNSESSQTSC